MIRIKRLKSSSDLLIWKDFENKFFEKTGYKILLKSADPLILEGLFIFFVILTKLTFIIFLISLININIFEPSFSPFHKTILIILGAFIISMIFIDFLNYKIEKEKRYFYSANVFGKYWINHDLFLNFVKKQSENLINNLKTTNENQEDFINKLTKPIENELLLMKENLILFSKHFHDDFHQIFGVAVESKWDDLNASINIRNLAMLKEFSEVFSLFLSSRRRDLKTMFLQLSSEYQQDILKNSVVTSPVNMDENIHIYSQNN